MAERFVRNENREQKEDITFCEAAIRFIRVQKGRGNSPVTVNHYERTIKKLAKFLCWLAVSGEEYAALIDEERIEIGREQKVSVFAKYEIECDFRTFLMETGNLKKAPCRYSGSVYLDNMVIAGHNYSSHFSGIENLSSGDRVVFTDTDGNRFEYGVAAIEVLPPTAVEEMASGEWNLTLFTCNATGTYRIAIRCDK